MSKKGITLIELLVVIAILAIIMMITIPFVGSLVSNSETEIYKRSLKSVEEAARMYAFRNVVLMPSDPGETLEININTLIEEGYLDPVVDPRGSGGLCEGVVTIVVDSESKYHYFPILNCGENYSSKFEEYGLENITHASIPGGYRIVATLTNRTALSSISLNGSEVNMFTPNLLNYDSWTSAIGATSATGFNINGAVAETTMVLKENPWGQIDAVWASLQNDATSDADGGWNTNHINIDNTRTYRFTVWIKRENAGTGSGTGYYGLYSYNSIGSNVGVLPRTGGTANTNPYFWAAGYTNIARMNTEWILAVAHVHPFGYSGALHPDTGFYGIDGTKIVAMLDYQWNSTSARAAHRTYLYYSTKTDERMYWYRPRLDVVDANMVPLSTLIKGHEHPTLYNNEVSFDVTTSGVHYFELKDPSGKITLYPYWIQ